MAMLLVSGLLILLVYIYRLLSDPLRDVPGPFLARFTRLWELSRVWQLNFEDVNLSLHKKYGPIVRLAPGRYSIDDCAASKQIYGHASNFAKSSFYHAFGNPDKRSSDLFSDLDKHRHGQNRRKVASLYSMTSLLSYEPFVDHQIAVLGEHLRSFAAAGCLVDIPSWIQYYAFDVIGELTVGEPFGMMTAGKDELGILSAFHEGSAYSSRVGLFSELHYYIGLATRILGIKFPFIVVVNFIIKQIHLRQTGERSSNRTDFLSTLLALREEGKINDHDLFTTLGANIAAGSDTIAVTLSSLIRFLMRSPACTNRLHEEISAFEAAGKISNPVTFQEAQQMPYVQAVIKETLRLHPATGQPLARVVPSGGAKLAGKFFPAGTVVGMNPWVLHRNKEAFGDDADSFRPERWLVQKEEASRLDQNLYTFGGGARSCIGRNISLLELSKIVPQLYRQFDFLLSDDDTYSKNNVWFVKPRFKAKIATKSLL